MDQHRAPMVEALAAYHEAGRYGFTPPGHRQGRGVDPRVIEVMGLDPFRDDVLAASGLDDRSSSGGYLKQAEELMAEAVGADHAFFSTCGSSLSVKAAMLAVAGHHGDLLLPRDPHKSVVAGLIFSGLWPCWVTPSWDPELHIAHPPSPQAYADAWARHPQAGAALVVSPTPYGTCADIEGIAHTCHERGRPLIVDEASGGASAVSLRSAHLGDGRRRRCLRRQRAQDGRRVRARLGLSRPGRPRRPVAHFGLRRPADDDQPERPALHRAGRLAAPDG
jgi:lysine decarboxylase